VQTPVRFYITQSDDQPVVKTIPVAVRPCAPEPEQASIPSRAERPRGDERRRVTDRVRSMVKRTDKLP
jgi:hypothetical protein